MATQTRSTTDELTDGQALGLIIVSLPLWAVSYVLVTTALAGEFGFVGGFLLGLALLPPAITAVGVRARRRE